MTIFPTWNLLLHTLPWIPTVHVSLIYACGCTSWVHMGVYATPRAPLVFANKSIPVLHRLPDELQTWVIFFIGVERDLAQPPTLWEAHLKVKTHLSALDLIKQPWAWDESRDQPLSDSISHRRGRKKSLPILHNFLSQLSHSFCPSSSC